MDKIKQLLYKASAGFTFLPLYLAVNISNVCNRQCSFCPYHSPTLAHNEHYKWFKSQPDFLSASAFKSWLTNLGDMSVYIKHISITGKGEPFLNKEIMLFCGVINGFGIPFSITTNGDLLTDEIIDRLEKFDMLRELRVSVYDDSFKWEFNPSFPVTFYNQTGKHITGMVDGYKVYCEGNSGNTVSKDFNNKSCRTPWSFATINTDGWIVPCYSFNEIGHISEPFNKVWNGRHVRKFRMDAIRCKAEHSDCKNCGVNL